MELQFEKQECLYMKKVVCQTKEAEQTQELRLPDAMPDIGRVLGCWGQALIRGKYWRSDEIGANGGVMVWVLYAAEDDGDMQIVETWIPFQLKWNLPDNQRDGAILLQPALKDLDARSISARKLILRCAVSVTAQAMEPSALEYFTPGSLPDDVQIKAANYPVVLPVEAGEKAFELEENIALPDLGRIIRCCASASITEQKVMASRLVFRGEVELDLLCLDDAGNVRSAKHQFPFGQYTDLDRDHSASAASRIIPIMTGFELQSGEGGDLIMKASVAAQYVISDRRVICLAEDAYSTAREMTCLTEEWMPPAELDSAILQSDIQIDIQDDIQNVVDAAALHSHPTVSRDGEITVIEMPVHYLLLCLDANGSIKMVEARNTFRWELCSDEHEQFQIYPEAAGNIGTELTTHGVALTDSAALAVVTVGTEPMTMLTGIELGEEMKKDTNRPSLILRRPCGMDLWNIAKEYHTTVASIEKANGITGEPDADRILLIPVS